MNENKIFMHDNAVQKAVAWHASPNLTADMRPEALLDLFSPEFAGECGKSAGRELSIGSVLYYLLLEHRRIAPAFYPPHDICLTLANLVRAGEKGGRLLIMDPKLVPVAMLFASQEWEIALPKEAESLMARLNHYIKDGFTVLPEKPEKDAVVLAGDPRLCLEEGKVDFIREARKTICLTNWDFLGVKGNESYRRYWLEKSGVAGILQLPRLKRQGSAAYPAIVRIVNEKSDLVRMARIEKVEIGKGVIDQQHALSLMLDAPDGQNSLDVETKSVMVNPGCVLTPAVWLNASPRTSESNSAQLGKCVQIIRCQLRRIKLTEESKFTFGEQPDGSFISREAAMAAMQPQCGLLLAGLGDIVRTEFRRKGSQFKFLLRKHDILFAFRGTMESLGKVGFVASDPDAPTITGTAFYILRPLAGIDPVWLFWHLKSKEARNAILARSSGTTMLTIGVEELGALPIRLPKPEELEQILALHAGMAEKTSQISRCMMDIEEKSRKVSSLLFN